MKNNIEKIGPCEFGAVTRNSLDNMILEFRDFRKEIKNEFTELKKTNTELYNHLSNRFPPWVTILFTILGSLVVGLTVGILK